MTKQWKWKLPLKKQAPEPLKAEKQLRLHSYMLKQSNIPHRASAVDHERKLKDLNRIATANQKAIAVEQDKIRKELTGIKRRVKDRTTVETKDGLDWNCFLLR